jgi:hypothetical protein
MMSMADTFVQKGAGLQGLDTSSLSALAGSLQNDSTFGIPNYVIAGGVVVLGLLMLGGGRRGRR